MQWTLFVYIFQLVWNGLGFDEWTKQNETKNFSNKSIEIFFWLVADTKALEFRLLFVW